MPILVIIAAAGVGVVIDQLVAHGEVAGTILNAFFGAVQAIGDAVFAAVGGVINVLPNAADLDLHVPSGVIGAYNFLDAFLPMHEALAFGAIYIGALLAIAAFRLAVTIYHLIPKPLMGT